MKSFLVSSLVLCLFCVSSIESIMFYLPANERKCLKEEIDEDILVKGEFEVTSIAGQTTKLEVTDSKGHILYSKDEAAKGKFAFTTDEYDVFQVCFETRVIQHIPGTEGIKKEITLHLKHGVEAKDYENVSKSLIFLI